MARRADTRRPRLKVVSSNDEVASDPSDDLDLDLSDVITDIEELRQPASDAARAVMQQARLTTGTIKTLSQGRSDVFRMNPYDLNMKPGWNIAREADPEVLAHIDWLARDIAKEGVKQPYRIHHEDGRFYITDGHLRQYAVFRAMNKYAATIMSVPVILGAPGETEKDRTLMMLRANSGLAIKPWGKGALMKRLLGWGWSDKQIADEFHCSRGRVRQLLDLQSLPSSMVDFIRQGLAADHVMTTYRTLGPEKAAVELSSEVVFARAIGAKRAMPKHGRGARLGTLDDNKRQPKPTKLTTILEVIRRFSVCEDGDQWVVRMSTEDGLTLARLAGMEVPYEGVPSNTQSVQAMQGNESEEDDDSSRDCIPAMAH